MSLYNPATDGKSESGAVVLRTRSGLVYPKEAFENPRMQFAPGCPGLSHSLLFGIETPRGPTSLTRRRQAAQNNGESTFRIVVNNRQVEEWIANDNPSRNQTGRRFFHSTQNFRACTSSGRLNPHRGHPSDKEYTPLDYIELHRYDK